MSNDQGCGTCADRATSAAKRIIDKHKYPEFTVKPDGSLLFKKAAPVLPGYKHNPHNVKLLNPDTVPCKDRITLPVLRRGGNYEILNQCNHFDCEMRGKDVNDEICRACPLRNIPSKKSPIVARQEGRIPTEADVRPFTEADA